MRGSDPEVQELRSVTFTADDFGLTLSVNEAVERAFRDGRLNAASLMVGAPAVADAVERARRLPGLNVGLHLVVIEGAAVLPRAQIPDLVDDSGWFPSDQLRLGLRYALSPRVRHQLATEIRAQFAAFAATGLALHHADAHKHMHLHPAVGRMMLNIGREFGLRRVRVPAEPPDVLARCGHRAGIAGRAIYHWTNLLRRQVTRAGMAADDNCFGIAWSGHMTSKRVEQLLAALPEGSSEIYFHPATRRDDLLRHLMPDYEHVAELETLLKVAAVD